MIISHRCPYYRGTYTRQYSTTKYGTVNRQTRTNCADLCIDRRFYPESLCASDCEYKTCPQYRFMKICQKYGKEK